MINLKQFFLIGVDVNKSMESFVFNAVRRDGNPTSLESDPKNRFIFWLDGARGSLHRVNRDGTGNFILHCLLYFHL